MVIDLINLLYFCFIKIFIIDLIISFRKTIYLAINRAILIEKKVSVRFFGLSL